jgi:hypothetical protein
VASGDPRPRRTLPPIQTIRFSKEYEHFDKLIWTVPTWCTAITIGTVAAVGTLLRPPAPVEARFLAILTAGTGVMFLVAAGYVLSRYRMHQSWTYRQFIEGSTSRWFGAQKVLQTVVAACCGFLSFLTFYLIFPAYPGTVALAAASLALALRTHAVSLMKTQGFDRVDWNEEQIARDLARTSILSPPPQK